MNAHEQFYRAGQLKKFENGLNQTLERGVTQGLHPTIYYLCCLAKSAGLSKSETVQAVELRCKGYNRGEVAAEFDGAIDNYDPEYKPGVYKKTASTGKSTAEIKAERVQVCKVLIESIAGGEVYTENSLIELSPVNIKDMCPTEQQRAQLKALIPDNGIFFCGTRPNATGAEHIKRVNQQNILHSHFIANPLSGYPRTDINSDGVYSTYVRRADVDTVSCKHVVLEHDDLPLEYQLAFWVKAVAAGLPIKSIVHSGKKSIHAILTIQNRDLNDWKHNIKSILFEKYFKQLGFDNSCSNAARLTRLAGHLRNDTGKLQRLLYLDTELKPMPVNGFISAFNSLCGTDDKVKNIEKEGNLL